MAVNFFWDDGNKTTIRFVCEPNWTLEELATARHDGDALAASVGHRVGMILEEVPTIPIEVRHYKFGLFKRTSPQIVVMVVVAQHPFVRALINLLIKTTPSAEALVVLAQDLEEARGIVWSHLKGI